MGNDGMWIVREGFAPTRRPGGLVKAAHLVSREVTGRSGSRGAELILEDGVTGIVNAQLTGRLSILATGPGRQRERETERKGCLERKVERKTKQETEAEKEREQQLSHPAQKFPGLPQPREQSPAEG